MQRALSPLIAKGIRILPYLVTVSCIPPHQVVGLTRCMSTLFARIAVLNLMVNWKKSFLILKQTIQFINTKLDSLRMLVTLWFQCIMGIILAK